MKKPSKCYTCYGTCYYDYTLGWWSNLTPSVQIITYFGTLKITHALMVELK
jgi:hypothetical protein